jgi:mannosyltransferase OCH1-like enzyme
MIPKIIWQTHENKYNDLLPFQKDITNTWKNLNPGWEYRYVGAEERSLAVKEYDEFLHSYYLESAKTHQSDIWRLVTIYNHGGFYSDMDAVCVKGIDETLLNIYDGKDLVFSPEGFQHSGIGSSNFGAVKNNKIIKEMIDKIILEYRNTDIKDIPNLPFASLENRIVSEVAMKNKELIFFNNDYYSHAAEYKTLFNSNLDVVFNKEKINYHTLCINMNWPIYYI